MPKTNHTDQITVSIDVESVLADTHPYFIKKYNSLYNTSYTTADMDDWDWVRTEVEWEVFDGITHGGWKNEADKISLREEDIPQQIATLATKDNITVDIVTARTGVETEMKEWLNKHEITEYTNFISTTKSKPHLNYTYYIDDNPNMIQNLNDDQFQFIPLGTHNRYVTRTAKTKPVCKVSTAITEIIEKT